MALTLDPVTVNTELAENYLKIYNNFEDWPAPNKFWHVKDYGYPTGTNSIGPYVARKLVEKIKEHESTFYQLEYVIRKTDKSDFQNNLLLMCQHLQCDDDTWNLGIVDEINVLMTEKMPLYALGCAAAGKSPGAVLNIVTTKKMAPICHLFVNLCAQVGWVINLIFLNDLDLDDYWGVIDGCACNVYDGENIEYGCTGVVTESADIDSAFDLFINSSVTVPWKLQKIYAQESVYDEVKEALAARCSRELVQSCHDAYAAKGKLFVCDSLTELSEGDALHVLVEAYRTTKELCALLQQEPARALSLWAADSQLAHEVALAAPMNLVWINEYASFHGPPAASLPVFERLYSYSGYTYSETLLRDLKKRWIDWNKLTKNERIDSIMNTVQGLSTAPAGFDSIIDFQNAILNAPDESFVSLDDGKICFCVERPPFFEDFIDLDIDPKKAIEKSIIATVRGMPVAYGKSIEHLGTTDLLKSLEKAGMPVLHNNYTEPFVNIEKVIFIKRVKVIRSNFGTIFAN